MSAVSGTISRFWSCILFSLFMLTIISAFETSLRKSRAIAEDGSNRSPAHGKLCGSLDIRNKPFNLMELENCTVVEGYLQILLIDYAKPEAYDSLSFPLLTEITDYLLFYRVFGLKSLRKLFPNLAVIRGQSLFSDYALIVYEMPDLMDLGLVSLTTIVRGAVRLEKNPKLCFIETIDWTKIAVSVKMEDNFFQKNKDIKECVNKCPDNCPSTLGFDRPVQRCWTINDCQRIMSCADTCESGLCNGTICCNSNCLGSCTGPLNTQCTVCKDVIQYHEGNQVCASRCSPGTYKYKDRRCLLSDQCKDFTDYKLPNDVMLRLVIPDDIKDPGLCVAKCPSHYKEDPKNAKKCIKCVGQCPRKCTTAEIDSINSAQALRGCTVINGNLIISIMGGSQIGKELEESLADIEEVTGYIRIFHSYSLLSLHFFKKLRLIGGAKLVQERYSLVVVDNLNLEELFLENVAKNLKLQNGTVNFQYNRKLCPDKIYDFVKKIGHENITETMDISVDTNGDQTPCTIDHLNLSLVLVTAHLAIIKWTKFATSDSRHLISYTIRYKEAPVKNVTIFQGRDACTNDEWKTIDVPPEEDSTNGEEATEITNYLLRLKPWTQYAIYVQTLTISTAVRGAISNLEYFRTLSEFPTSPTNLVVRALDPGELLLTWEPPIEPNGNVTHYQVYWQIRYFIPEEYELRDYCDRPLTASVTKIDPDEEVDDKNVTTNGNCCECPKTPIEIQTEERNRFIEIQFQNYLQNNVYLKRRHTLLDGPATTLKPKNQNGIQPTNILKVLSDKYGQSNTSISSTGLPPSLANMTTTLAMLNATTSAVPQAATTPTPTTTEEDHGSKVNPYFKAYVYNKLEVTISNLGHFQDYNIEVIACQEKDPNDIQRLVMCSNSALGLGRTLAKDTADNINTSTIVVTPMQNVTGAVWIHWDDPPQPNGLILTYEIKYMTTNINNVKPIVICITYKMYRDVGKRGHKLDKLEPGNYTFRIRATSLAGNGSWTEPQYFYIPDKPDGKWSKETIIAVIVAVVVLVIVLTIIAVWTLAKKRFNTILRDTIYTSANPEYIQDYNYYEADEWEVDRENVQLIKELGQGSFGMVYQGLVKNLISGQEYCSVAVKTTNTNSNDHDRFQFLQEASIMKAFKCHHVVRLMGVVSKGQPAYVLMELMAQGDLKNFLRIHRPDEEDNNGRSPPTLKQILQMSGEIADGMAYLADKKYVHRDLAARNCMVGEDMTVKIGDFGMTRDIYETDYYRKGNRGLLPVRWMAPESLKDGVFTSMSDVWSYGVVLWEMATLAAQPYQGLTNEEVLKYVGSGKIMDTPERCPPKLYDLMVKCWRYRHKQRPTFKEIIEILLPDLDKNFKEVSYFFSEENAKYEEAKQQAATNSQTHNFEEHLEDVDDDEIQCPRNDYVDEANLPMLGGVGASNGHSVELSDIFTDNGTYPHYSGSRKHGDSAGVSDCTPFHDVDEGAAAQSIDFNRQSVCSSPNSAIGGSSDGSKDSSKSSSGSYAHMNGVSVANGHVPVHLRTTPC